MLLTLMCGGHSQLIVDKIPVIVFGCLGILNFVEFISVTIYFELLVQVVSAFSIVSIFIQLFNYNTFLIRTLLFGIRNGDHALF